MLEKIRVLAAAALAAALLALPARAAGGYRIGVLDGLVALWDGGEKLTVFPLSVPPECRNP